MKRLAVALALALALTGGPSFAQSAEEFIRPGDSIGSVRLGMTVEEVAGLLGRPPDAEAAEADLKVLTWNLDGERHTRLTPSPVLAIAVNGSSAVEQITTTSSAFATLGGVGLGASLQQFKADLRAPFRGFKDSAGLRHLRFDTQGLDLIYDITAPGLTLVKSLTVFKPAATMPGPPPAIRAGEGIGPVRIGMTVDDAVRAMGRPQKRDGNGLTWALAEKDPMGAQALLVAFTDPNGRIAAIMTDAVTYNTAQGTAAGSTLLEFQAEFGDRYTLQNVSGAAAQVIVYSSQGILGFYLMSDPQKRLQIIAVARPGLF